jgi:hypothetical protein
MKKIAIALSVASSVTGFLAWVEAHSRRPGAEALALQFKKEHAWIGAVAGILVLAT